MGSTEEAAAFLCHKATKISMKVYAPSVIEQECRKGSGCLRYH
jgi:hypothetical protein